MESESALSVALGESGLVDSVDRVLDAIDQAVVVADLTGSIVAWNRAARTLCGWAPEHVIGRPVVDVLASGGGSHRAAALIRQSLAGISGEGEVEVDCRLGSPIAVHLTTSPVPDRCGDQVASVFAFREVTEVGKSVEALRVSRHRFRALIKGSGDLFAITDAEGVITFVDGPVEALLGVDAAALLGRSLFDLVDPRDAGRARALWAVRRASTGPMPAEDFCTRRAGGAWLCMSLLVSNLVDDPTIRGMVVTARDVTVRRNLELARNATRGVSEAILRATNESALLDEVCRVILDDTTYCSAWIGLRDASRLLGVRIVAGAGGSASSVDSAETLTRADSYRGPLAIALETGEVVVVQDIASVPMSTPWRRPALDRGFRSMIALPLGFANGEHGVLAIHSERPDVFASSAVEVLERLAADVAYGVDSLRIRAQATENRVRLEAALDSAVCAIASAAELRDPYTAGHQRWVAQLATAIATELGFDPDVVLGIGVAATIHDIGKLAVPAEILSKPGRLSDIEFALIRQHAQAGHDIVKGIDFPWPVAEMILQHHERLDGSGYPRGLQGDAILPGARVIAVADIVEAMQSHRPYRTGLGVDAALDEIRRLRGSRLDAAAVDACIRLFDDLDFKFT